jgi:hypothetical protein
MMTPKQFNKYQERDGGCLHCGETEAVAPHHRVNRGFGGKHDKANQPSNIIVICSVFNGLMESSPYHASLAKIYGWKLSSWADPKQQRVYDTQTGKWYLLDDDFGRSVVK